MLKRFAPIPWLRGIEIISGFAGALTCQFVSASFALSELSLRDGHPGALFPTPGIYFIEIMLIGLVGFISIANPSAINSKIWKSFSWICGGILMAFVILGAWTIGFPLIPGMLAFLIPGILSDFRQKDDIALHIIYFISAGLAQSTFVFLILFL